MLLHKEFDLQAAVTSSTRVLGSENHKLVTTELSLQLPDFGIFDFGRNKRHITSATYIKPEV